MKLNRVLIILATLFIAGCVGTLPWDYTYYRSFISIYFGGEPCVVNGREGTPFMRVGFTGEHYRYDSTGEKKEIYDELCRKNQDMGYNRRGLKPEAVPDPSSFSTAAFWKNFVAIDVVSDRDFDADHPAGTSLGDVMMYEYYGFWKYVQNNYYISPDDEERVPIRYSTYENGYINSIPAGGLRLISELNLYMTEVPASAEGEHNLTITILTDDGVEYVIHNTITMKEGIYS